METVGQRIKHVRKQNKLNQTNFGKMLRVRQSTVAGFESGRYNASKAVIYLISLLFNVSEDWLLNG